MMSDCVAKNCQHDCLAQDEKDPDGVWLLRSGSGFLLRFPLPLLMSGTQCQRNAIEMWNFEPKHAVGDGGSVVDASDEPK